MMGLDNLEFLKTTLLDIDSADNEIKRLREQNKEAREKIARGKSNITTWENQIKKCEKQVKDSEKALEYWNKLDSDGTLHSTDLEKTTLKKAERKRKTAITRWNMHLETYWNNRNNYEGFFFTYFFIFLASLLGTNKLLTLYATDITPDSNIFNIILWTIVLLSIIITYKLSGRIKSRKYREERLRVEDLFGDLHYVNSNGIKFLSYSPLQKYGAYFLTKGELPSGEVEDIGPIFDTEYETKLLEDKMITKFSTLERHLLPVILIPETAAEKRRKGAIHKRIDSFEKLRRSVDLGEEAKSKIAKNDELISKKQDQIEKGTFTVDSNNLRIKELQKEIKQFWSSISHLIPYSNLIK